MATADGVGVARAEGVVEHSGFRHLRGRMCPAELMSARIVIERPDLFVPITHVGSLERSAAVLIEPVKEPTVGKVAVNFGGAITR